jgi:hypothetical protein
MVHEASGGRIDRKETTSALKKNLFAVFAGRSIAGHCEQREAISPFRSGDFREIDNFEIAAPASIMQGQACEKCSSQ